MLGNKKNIPLIFPPNDSDIIAKMTLIESFKRIKNKVDIVHIEPKNDFHTILAEEPNPEIGIPSKGRISILEVAAMSLILSTTEKPRVAIIDDRMYSEKEGNLMHIFSSPYIAEPTLSTQGNIIDSDYMSPKMSFQKKDRKKNNRKTKKRKKAKNGR